MPSHLHEALLQLFRNRPELAPELLSALQAELPAYTDVRIDSADLTEIQPAEYRADLVVALTHGAPVLGIVVEVQLSPDERKRFAWPAYVANLRARLKCPVCLLVVTRDEAVARWAARSIQMGCGSIAPVVVGPDGVPEIIDEVQARADPELAVLSAIAHGRDADIHKYVQIALAAQLASLNLDEDRSILYLDLILASLSEAARRELQTMKPAGYEFQSDFAREMTARGRQEGRQEGRQQGHAEGRAALVVRLLTVRFGPLSDEAQTQVTCASSAELDLIGERLLTAPTLKDALGPH
ncbi:MAG TPA: DUF4351 domain-containing protein [Steroidobacteraceae bacterium]|jgi:hypothetical protein